jgi:hypothetical protein
LERHVTLGLSWYPEPNLRLIANYIHGRVRPGAAKRSGAAGFLRRSRDPGGLRAARKDGRRGLTSRSRKPDQTARRRTDRKERRSGSGSGGGTGASEGVARAQRSDPGQQDSSGGRATLEGFAPPARTAGAASPPPDACTRKPDQTARRRTDRKERRSGSGSGGGTGGRHGDRRRGGCARPDRPRRAVRARLGLRDAATRPDGCGHPTRRLHSETGSDGAAQDRPEGAPLRFRLGRRSATRRMCPT